MNSVESFPAAKVKGGPGEHPHFSLIAFSRTDLTAAGKTHHHQIPVIRKHRDTGNPSQFTTEILNPQIPRETPFHPIAHVHVQSFALQIKCCLECLYHPCLDLMRQLLWYSGLICNMLHHSDCTTTISITKS